METVGINVRADINALEVGASVDFPIERYDYVVSCRTRLQMTEKPKQFRSKKKGDVVTITRLEDKSPDGSN